MSTPRTTGRIVLRLPVPYDSCVVTRTPITIAPRSRSGLCCIPYFAIVYQVCFFLLWSPKRVECAWYLFRLTIYLEPSIPLRVVGVSLPFQLYIFPFRFFSLLLSLSSRSYFRSCFTLNPSCFVELYRPPGMAARKLHKRRSTRRKRNNALPSGCDRA